MRRELDLSTREHREYALVYMALDPFNDKVGALGARAQERICEAMGRLLRGNTRAMDASCRMDDRHFAVLLSGVGLATAHSRMEGLRRQCATQIVMLDGEELGFTVAMGVAGEPTAPGRRTVVNFRRWLVRAWMIFMVGLTSWGQFGCTINARPDKAFSE